VIVDDHIGARVMQLAGDGGAHAARATGDEHYLVLQRRIHGVSL
jgi:hypothetical protein